MEIKQKLHPIELEDLQALEIAYSRDLFWCRSKLLNKTSLLIECEKQLIPYLFMHFREALKGGEQSVEYLDGRNSMNGTQNNLLRNMVDQITYWVRNATHSKILVIPHLDLLVSQAEHGGMTSEGREIIPLLYENPNLTYLSFQDPTFRLSGVIERIFPARRKLLGVDRGKLKDLILEKEIRKFPTDFPIQQLYQYVSGLNPIRLRQVMSKIDGIDYPADASRVLAQVREMTIISDVKIPQVDLSEDIGGYLSVKEKITKEILTLIKQRDQLNGEEELEVLDSLIPRGIIFHGPPGTGKTFFAKAMASSLNAAIQIISGPELKTKWVGESEANLRKVFFKARQLAPSLIVFDEIDSFAGARGSYSGTNVEHSMVNQLLTEMDGFRKEELVFVIGTTNFLGSIDPALLRPGRFELKIEIPYPAHEDRLSILKIYNKKLTLELSENQLEYMALKAGEMTDQVTNSFLSGDHLYSAMRYLKRIQIREARREFTQRELYMALRGGENKISLTQEERAVIATHEAGHTVTALALKDASPVERVSVDSDFSDTLGYVKHKERKNKFVLTKRQFLADLIVLMGGREAELLMYQDISTGSEQDIFWANSVAEDMVSRYGMSKSLGVRVELDGGFSLDSERLKDKAISEILENSRMQAREILGANRELLEAISNALIQEKVLERERILEIIQQHPLQWKKNNSVENTQALNPIVKD